METVGRIPTKNSPATPNAKPTVPKACRSSLPLHVRIGLRFLDALGCIIFIYFLHSCSESHLHNRAYVYKLSFDVLLVPTSPLPLRFSVGSGWELLWMSQRDNLSVQHEKSRHMTSPDIKTF